MDPLSLSPAQRALLPDAPPAAPATRGGDHAASFRDTLAQQDVAQGVRFSKHAQERIARRNIDLTPEHLARLDDAVARASAKGARESLVLMDDLALVVSVRNQTVITATSAASRQENVFTNIDSAVIA